MYFSNPSPLAMGRENLWGYISSGTAGELHAQNREIKSEITPQSDEV